MMWNLVWTPIDTCTSEFVICLGDEPVLTKRLCGRIVINGKESWLRFVESSYKFKFEDFNEFIGDFESNKQAKGIFNMTNGEEAFGYDPETSRLTWIFGSYTSNLNFTVELDERGRTQFAKEFRKFLNFYLEFYESNLDSDLEI